MRPNAAPCLSQSRRFRGQLAEHCLVAAGHAAELADGPAVRGLGDPWRHRGANQFGTDLVKTQAGDVGLRRFLKNIEESAAQGAARRACGGGNVADSDRFAEMGLDPRAGTGDYALAAADRREARGNLRGAAEVLDDGG